MSNLKTKRSDLSRDNIVALAQSLGTEAFPYPSMKYISKDDGSLEMEFGILADNDDHLTIYADTLHEHVLGLMYREMSIPSMLYAQEKALLARDLNSNERLFAIFGDAGSGKSHMAKMMARVRDPRGAEVVDCGGRYMGDLLFEQVIDFGEDFKTALTNRIRMGQLSPKSIEIFDTEFPDSLERDKSGKITDINWQKVGTAKDLGTKDKPEFETTAEAVNRAMTLIQDTIAKWENIPTQAVNTVGIRKQPGALIRAFKEGRELVLDEYTKKIEGSDDSLQTVLQFLTGEIAEATVENSMKVNGRDETYAFTFRREDMKPGFFVTMTGNKDSDGFSTHALSRSAYSRIPLFTIENPIKIDWQHRISQIMTGLPLSTLYSIFSDMAMDSADDFAETMIGLRTLGLDDKEVKEIPAHQMTLLRNWQSTNDAIQKLAEFYMFWSRIVDPQSDLYDPQNGNNGDYINKVLPEISASYRDETAMDFRKVIKDLSEAMKQKPHASTLKEDMNLRIDFNAVGMSKVPVEIRPEIFLAQFGTRLERVLLERIGILTKNKPNLQRAILKEARERGVLTVADAENDTIAKLLNQDMYQHFGGIGNISLLQSLIAERIRKSDKANAAKTDDELFGLDDAAALYTETKNTPVDADNPFTSPVVTLGDKTLVQAIALEGHAVDQHKVTKPDTSDLVNIEDFLALLKIPSFESVNMRSIWRKGLSNDNRLPNTDEYKNLTQIAEGCHDSNLGITTIMTCDSQGKELPTHVILDAVRKKSLIVTATIDDDVRVGIPENYIIVSYDDSDAETKVQAFINSSLQHEDRVDDKDLEGQLISAFMLRAQDKRGFGPLADMMTNRDEIFVPRPVYMVKQKALKR